jgi:chromosome segregation ATPase
MFNTVVCATDVSERDGGALAGRGVSDLELLAAAAQSGSPGAADGGGALAELERLRSENARLLRQIVRLRARLQQLRRDNDELTRALAHVQRESSSLRTRAQAGPAELDRVARVRLMLRDRACRNP